MFERLIFFFKKKSYNELVRICLGPKSRSHLCDIIEMEMDYHVFVQKK